MKSTLPYLIFLFTLSVANAQSLVLSTSLSDYSGYNISCNDATDGTIDLTVTGGTFPYTFAWSTVDGSSSVNGNTTEDLTALSSGTYTVIVTDSVGDADTLDVILSAPAAVAVSLYSPSYNGFNIHCHNGNTGEINATVSGGVAPYTYQWSTGDSVPDIGGLGAGTYELIVIGANGCSDTVSIVLNEPVVLTTSLTSPLSGSGLEVDCEGASSANIDLTVSGGTSPFQFNWSNGGITEDQGGLSAGWYSVQVEDANACIKYDSLEIREPSALNTTGSFHEYQPGQFFGCDTCLDGQATASVTGGTQPYTFELLEGGQQVAFQNGGTEATHSGLSPDAWYVGIITDAAGCFKVDSFLIPANQTIDPLDVIGAVSSYPGGYQVSSFGAADGEIDIQVEGGVQPYSYAWSTPDGSATADGATTQDISSLSAGTYTVVVTDDNSEQVEKAFILNQPATALGASMSVSGGGCFGDDSGRIIITTSGGVPPYQYLWSTADGSSHADGATTDRIENLAPGTYEVVVTDAGNDSLSFSYQIQAASEITTSITPSFDNMGYHFQCLWDTTTLDLTVSGGIPPYGYQWDNGKFSQDVDVNGGGWYHVIVTDDIGCQKRDSILLNSPPEMQMDAQWFTHPNGGLFSCDTCNDAQVTLAIHEAIEPVSSTLSSTTQTLAGPTFTGIHADTIYNLRVEDGLGCIIERSGTEAFVLPREGFSSLGVSAELSQYPGGYNISKHGGVDGWIDLDVFGQMSMESVLWSDGSTDHNRENLSAGTYEVTISDNAGQSVTESWTLTEPANLLHAEIFDSYRGCGPKVHLNAMVMGGTPPYSYQWEHPNGSIEPNTTFIESDQYGTYELQVIDANGDTVYSVFENQLSDYHVDVSLPTVLGTYHVDCDGQGGSAIVTVNEGTAPYHYRLDNYGGFLVDTLLTSSEYTFNNLSRGWYRLTVTDSSGCVANSDVVLQGAIPPRVRDADWHIYPNGELFSCDTCNDAQFTLMFDTTNMSDMPEALQIEYDYFLESTSHTIEGPVFSGVHADTLYKLIIIDEFGCAIDRLKVEEISIPREGFTSLQVSAQISNYPGGYNISSHGGNDGSLGLNVSGAMSSPQIVWSDTAMESNSGWYRGNLSAGTYEVTVSDNAGQSVTESWTLIEPAKHVSVSIGNQSHSCGASVYLGAYVNGGTPPYTYTWKEPNGDIIGHGHSFISGSSSEFHEGYYTIMVVDANGDSTNNSYNLVHDNFSVDISSPEINGHNVSCQGGDGSIEFLLNGGAAPFTIHIDGEDGFKERIITSDTLVVLDSLDGGDYWIDVNDANGCYGNAEITLSPEPIRFADGQWHTYPNGELFSCDTCNDAQVTVMLEGGVPPYTINLESTTQNMSGPAFTEIFADTLYSVRIVDSRGCELLMSGEEGVIVPRGGFNTLQVSAEVSAYPGGYSISANGGNDGWIGLQVHGMMSNPQIVWSDTLIPSNDAWYRENLSAGTYQVTVSDNAGQSVTKSWTLTEPAADLTGYLKLTKPRCSNSGDGEIKAVINGGVPPYNYQWNTGDQNIEISGISAGPYELLVTDASGDSLTLADTLIAPDEITTSIIPSFDEQGYQLRCHYGDTTTLNLAISGGKTPYRYHWDDGSFSKDTKVSEPRLYRVSITDDNGCNTIDSLEVNAPPLLIPSSTEWLIHPNGSVFSCDTCNDAQLTIEMEGGIPPYQSSLISDNETITGPVFTGVDADVPYSMVIVDAIGCQAGGDEPVVLSRVSQLSVTAELSTYPGGYNVSVNGATDGRIRLNITGLIGVPTIVWSDTVFENWYEGYSRENLPAGAYEVTVSDPMGSVTKSFTLTEPSNGLEAQIVNLNPECSSYANFQVSVNGGTPPYKYYWSTPDTTNMGGWEHLSNNVPGGYSVLVVDANQDSTNTQMDFSPRAFEIFAVADENGDGTHVSCNGTDGRVTVTVYNGVGPFEYRLVEHKPDTEADRLDTTIVSSDSTLVFEGIPAGDYTATVKEVGTINGCYEKQPVILKESVIDLTVEPHVYPNMQFFSCDTCNDGKLVIDSIYGGTPPYQLLWSTGATTDTLSGMYADSVYGITVTDANGCVMTDEGSLPRGDISVIFNLDVNATLSQYPGGYNVGCFGCNDGSIELHINGGIPPYEISWSTGDSTSILNDLTAGTYSVYVTDQNGNEFSQEYTLVQPSNQLAVQLNGNFSSCNWSGTLKAMVNGGITPYAYYWSDEGLYNFHDGWEEYDVYETGTYGLWVVDANKDSVYAEISVSESDELTAQAFSPTIDGSANASCTGNDGSIHLEIYGGIRPYTVEVEGYLNFDPQQGGEPEPFYGNFTVNDSIFILDSLKAGNYNINISDASYCASTWTSVELVSPPPFKINVVSEELSNGEYFSCDTCADGNVTLESLGGQAPFNYMWLDVPEEFIMVDVRGASISFDDAGMILNTDAMEGMPPVSFMGQSRTDIAPNEFYTVIAVDQQGCMGMKAFNLEGPGSESQPDPDWKLNGNSGLDPDGQQRWLGTNDSTDVLLKANNAPQLRLRADGGTEVLGALILPNMPIANPCDRQMLSIGENGEVQPWGPCPPEDCETIMPWSVPPNGSLTDVTLCHEYERVGIGYSNPTHTLHVAGTGHFSQNVGIGHDSEEDIALMVNPDVSLGEVGIHVKGRDINPALTITHLLDDPYFSVFGNGQLKIVGNTEGSTESSIPMIDVSGTDGEPAIQIHSDGVVNFGSPYTGGPHADYRLSVKGKVLAKEIYVTLDHWSDFVFDEDYELTPLDELKSFIAENHHLPDVPSEAEILEGGNSLGDMDAILLQKIEELTLYVLELNDKLKQVEQENAELRTRLK